MNETITVPATVNLKDIPVAELLGERAPIDKLCLLQVLENITEDDLREICIFAGVNAFNNYVMRVENFAKLLRLVMLECAGGDDE